MCISFLFCISIDSLIDWIETFRNERGGEDRDGGERGCVYDICSPASPPTKLSSVQAVSRGLELGPEHVCLKESTSIWPRDTSP